MRVLQGEPSLIKKSQKPQEGLLKMFFLSFWRWDLLDNYLGKALQSWRQNHIGNFRWKRLHSFGWGYDNSKIET